MEDMVDDIRKKRTATISTTKKISTTGWNIMDRSKFKLELDIGSSLRGTNASHVALPNIGRRDSLADIFFEVMHPRAVRELIATRRAEHPEFFRMDKGGGRTSDINVSGCCCCCCTLSGCCCFCCCYLCVC